MGRRTRVGSLAIALLSGLIAIACGGQRVEQSAAAPVVEATPTARGPWATAADEARRYLAQVGGIEALDAEIERANAGMASSSRELTDDPLASAFLAHRRDDAPPAAFAEVAAALAEVAQRCAGTPPGHACLGARVGEARLRAFYALVGRVESEDTEGRAPTLRWYHPADEVEPDEASGAREYAPLAYAAPIPEGFVLAPWDPMLDGTDGRRLIGEGVVLAIRSPERALSAEPRVCDAILPRDVAPSALRFEALDFRRRPVCDYVGESRAFFWWASSRPMVFGIHSGESGDLTFAREVAFSVARGAAPIFEGRPFPAPEASATASSRDRQVAPTWGPSEHEGWEIPLVVESPSEAEWRTMPRAPRLAASEARQRAIVAAVAEARGELLARCPELTPLVPRWIPSDDTCEELMSYGWCSLQVDGDLRTFSSGSSGNGLSGGGGGHHLSFGSEGCNVRGVRTLWENIDPGSGYATFARDPGAPHPESLPLHGYTRSRRGAADYPGAAVVRGRRARFVHCPAAVRFGSGRVQAGPWVAGEPPWEIAGRRRVRGSAAAPEGLRVAETESGELRTPVRFRPRARRGRYTFYTSGRFRYGGERLVVFDRERQAHRALFDALWSRFRGNIQLHDVIGSVVVISVTGDDRVDRYRGSAVFLIDIERGRGKELRVGSAAPVGEPDTEMGGGDRFEPRGSYGAPYVGFPFVVLEEGEPVYRAIQHWWPEQGDRAHCELRDEWDELVRGLR